MPVAMYQCGKPQLSVWERRYGINYILYTKKEGGVSLTRCEKKKRDL